MTACLFGTYVGPHSANRLLRLALVGAGWDVVECHAPLWEETPYKTARYFGAGSLARLGVAWTAAMVRLVGRWRQLAGAPPLVVVPFGGHLDVLVARRVCRPRLGLVFVPLVSLTETLVEDRRVFPAGGLRARGVAALDRLALRAAELVLADTAAHAEYLARLGAPRARLDAWHHGVEPEFLSARTARPVPRRVIFYGRHLPLHGVDTIVEASVRLGERADIELIGGGPERARAEALARRLGARIRWREEVPLESLPDELASAAVVLGVFGASEKAGMVVPNKVYQAAAAGRPLVTRDGPALREAFRPGEHCLACPPADPDALATAVRTLLDDPGFAERVGHAARAHVLDRFAPDRQAARLGAILTARFGSVPPLGALAHAADA